MLNFLKSIYYILDYFKNESNSIIIKNKLSFSIVNEINFQIINEFNLKLTKKSSIKSNNEIFSSINLNNRKVSFEYVIENNEKLDNNKFFNNNYNLVKEKNLKYYLFNQFEVKDHVIILIPLNYFQDGKSFVGVLKNSPKFICIWNFKGGCNKIKTDFDVKNLFYKNDKENKLDYLLSINNEELYIFKPNYNKYYQKFKYLDNSYLTVNFLNSFENNYNTNNFLICKDSFVYFYSIDLPSTNNFLYSKDFSFKVFLVDYTFNIKNDYLIACENKNNITLSIRNNLILDNKNHLIEEKYFNVDGVITAIKLVFHFKKELFIVVAVNKSPKDKLINIIHTNKNIPISSINLNSYSITKFDYILTNFGEKKFIYLIGIYIGYIKLWDFDYLIDSNYLIDLNNSTSTLIYNKKHNLNKSGDISSKILKLSKTNSDLSNLSSCNSIKLKKHNSNISNKSYTVDNLINHIDQINQLALTFYGNNINKSVIITITNIKKNKSLINLSIQGYETK